MILGKLLCTVFAVLTVYMMLDAVTILVPISAEDSIGAQRFMMGFRLLYFTLVSGFSCCSYCVIWKSSL